MTVNQISIFLENKPESLSELTDVLAKNTINMRALSLADTSDFGIARIITDDCAAAEEILKANDYIVKTDRKSTRLNSSHLRTSRMPSSA